MGLVGREREQAALDELIAAARGGLSGALVLWGEAGIGKTSLVEYARYAATDLRFAHVVGVEPEVSLCFAGLHQLLRPFLGHLEGLPPPQAAALSSAFGLGTSSPPDRYLVGLATLTLLADAAAPQPLLCAIDDAHWVDPDSLEVLGFVARRLWAEGVAMLFAIRDPSVTLGALDGLPKLQITELPDEDAMALLHSIAATEVGREVAAILVAQSAGNPLAIAELVAALSPEQLAGASLLPDPLPVGDRIEARFLEVVRRLPADTQTFLVALAAEPSGEAAVVWRALASLGVGPEAAEPALDPGIVRLAPRVAFRHPLVRSAVYGGASSAERRRVHGALAAATDGEVDADRRAWHLAQAAVVPDADTAAALEAASGRARLRGGCEASAALLGRAAELSPAGPERSRRLLAAAEAYLDSGVPATAQALLAAVAPLADAVQRAHAERVEGTILLALGRTADALAALLRAAEALQPLDARDARSTLLTALSAALFSGHLAGSGTLDIAQAALAMPSPGTAELTVGDQLLAGVAALFTTGFADAAPHLRAAVDALRTANLSTEESLLWLGSGCWAAGALGDNRALNELARRLERRGREQGAVASLTRALYFLAMSELVDGALAAAAASFDESRQLMAARGDPTGVGQTLVHAWRGQEVEARQAADALARGSLEQGKGTLFVYAEHALGVLELGLGNYPAALLRARSAYEHDSYFLSTVALPDLVEAAVRCDEHTVARAALARSAERAAVSPTPLALGLVERSQALLAPDDDAELLFRRAKDHLDESGAFGHLGRCHLVYGEWLRRADRRIDARSELRAAYEQFTKMGAQAFARRARAELNATGEHVRARPVDVRTELTSQELQVARLAATRVTNREIGAQLFISASTVDYHLRKVYQKLGISSRRELTDRFAG
jgi:DNA-binding CsgD family transcriptional regulator